MFKKLPITRFEARISALTEATTLEKFATAKFVFVFNKHNADLMHSDFFQSIIMIKFYTGNFLYKTGPIMPLTFLRCRTEQTFMTKILKFKS